MSGPPSLRYAGARPFAMCRILVVPELKIKCLSQYTIYRKLNIVQGSMLWGEDVPFIPYLIIEKNIMFIIEIMKSLFAHHFI